jgi:hypothetical protein
MKYGVWESHCDLPFSILLTPFLPAPVFCPLRLLVGIWFQIYFTALTGLLFTFPSRYLFTIGLEKYLDLPVSTGGFPRAIRVPGYLRIETKKVFYFDLRGYHPLGPSFPARSANKKLFNSSAINSTSLPCNPHPKSQSVFCFRR